MMDRLGLVYGTADLRYNADLGYVYFELNPEYLWNEIEAGLPIGRAIATYMVCDPLTLIATKAGQRHGPPQEHSLRLQKPVHQRT
jgi:hypothetical protein